MPDSEKHIQPPITPPDPPRRKPNSVLRCCLWIAGSIGLAVGCLFLYFGYLVIAPLYQDTVYPHQSLYETSPVKNKSSVVQPLISKEQTFDVAVSVWVRGTKKEEKAWRAIQAIFDNAGKNSETLGTETSLDEEGLGFFNTGDEKMLYRPIFSDIVFRGLRLSDKHATASINLTFPTEKFREASLMETDLLSTFVLIPTSPSLMDSVVNYSSWKPDEVLSKYPLYRTWPFPMDSEYKGDKTLADLALESFGLQTPLIQFHEIPSRCPSTPSDEEAKSENDAEEFKDAFGNPDSAAFSEKFDELTMTAKHPHITTWSQLRVIDETHIMNLEAYNKAHEELKRTSCGQGVFPKPLRGLCERNYKVTGNIETRLELEVKDADGSTHTEWAYAPYLISDPSASGPMDLVPVSVHREDCTGKNVLDTTDHENSTSTFKLTDTDFMNVTWHISFMGRSPAKHELGTYVSWQPIVNHSRSDYQKVQNQDFMELWNSLRGVRKPDAHPRRRILLSIIEFSSLMISAVLTGIYWYTRTNTVYISVPGTLLLVASDSTSAFAQLIGATEEDWIITYIFTALLSLPSIYLKLGTVLRIELVWRGWLPTWRRMRPSHRERASERLDATMSWVRLMIFSSVFLFFLFIHEDNLQLLPPLHPPAPKSDNPRLTWLFSFLNNQLQWPFWFTGISSQIILNHKSRHFAGGYKLAEIAMFVHMSAQLLKYVPSLVGRYEARGELWAHVVLYWVIQAGLVCQAVMFPSVGSVGADEDED